MFTRHLDARLRIPGLTPGSPSMAGATCEELSLYRGRTGGIDWRLEGIEVEMADQFLRAIAE